MIGYGLAGRVFHCPFISAVPGLALTAIVQRHGDSARPSYPATRIAGDIEEVLGDRAIDLVVIATPNETHFDLAKRALMAGKHCVVDKPFAATSDEAVDLLKSGGDNARLIFSVPQPAVRRRLSYCEADHRESNARTRCGNELALRPFPTSLAREQLEGIGRTHERDLVRSGLPLD